jgi:internalin A
LNISNSNIETLGNLENLVNLKYLYCGYNQLTSLEGIENLVNLKELYCSDNQLISLEGIENLNSLLFLKELYCNNQLTSLEGIEKIVNLIKNNKQLKNNIIYNFIDSDDYIELNDLFRNLIKCDDNKINKYIEQIEQIIKELNGFQKYVLK